MVWKNENDRIDGGRLQCQVNPNHKRSLRDRTIFANMKIPLPTLYRLIFLGYLIRSPRILM